MQGIEILWEKVKESSGDFVRVSNEQPGSTLVSNSGYLCSAVKSTIIAYVDLSQLDVTR